jgi:hypothetical protein
LAAKLVLRADRDPLDAESTQPRGVRRRSQTTTSFVLDRNAPAPASVGGFLWETRTNRARALNDVTGVNLPTARRPREATVLAVLPSGSAGFALLTFVSPAVQYS